MLATITIGWRPTWTGKGDAVSASTSGYRIGYRASYGRVYQCSRLRLSHKLHGFDHSWRSEWPADNDNQIDRPEMLLICGRISCSKGITESYRGKTLDGETGVLSYFSHQALHRYPGHEAHHWKRHVKPSREIAQIYFGF